MPPMMLLPLIDDALAACGGEAGAKPTIGLDVRANGDRLQVNVTRTPGGSTATDASALASIRKRLSGLYGASASLEVAEVKARSVEARLELPLELAPDLTSEGEKGTAPM
jgi:LytS/YehU family sensor histidine kinase